MDLLLPELEFTDLALSPVDAPTRGEAEPAIDQLVRIGGPVALPIIAGDLASDREVSAFITANSQSFSFHVIYLAFSARPPEGYPLERVVLSFSLQRQDGGTPDPIALSMTPRTLDRPVEMSRTVKLAVPLKVVEAGVEQSRTTTSQQSFLQSYNELRPDPYWELQRVEGVPIRGSQRLCMVVQAPRGPCEGRLTVQVTVRGRRLGFFPHVGAPRDGVPISFPINR